MEISKAAWECSSKRLRTGFGEVDVSTPRDRRGEFEHQLLKKNHTGVSQDIEEKILSIVKEWQQRPLESFRAVVFPDAIHCHNNRRPAAALGYKSPVQYRTEPGFYSQTI